MTLSSDVQTQPLDLNRHTLQPNDTIPLENNQLPGLTYTTLQRSGTLLEGLQASHDHLRSKTFSEVLQITHQIPLACKG